MAETAYPFTDRPVSEAEWYKMARTWAPNGPIGYDTDPDFDLSIGGLVLTVSPGNAWIAGAYYVLDGVGKSFTVPANTSSNPRIDRLVFRRDLTVTPRTMTIERKQGSPAVTPTPPALTRTQAGVWEEPLYSFTVPQNSGSPISVVNDERRWTGGAGQGRAGSYIAAPIVSGSPTVYTTTNSVITQVTIPAQGYDYRVLVTGFTWGFVSTGAVWDIQYRVDTVGGTLITPANRVQSATQSVLPLAMGTGRSGVLTGEHDVLFVAVKISGSGGQNIALSGDPDVQSWVVQVVPA